MSVRKKRGSGGVTDYLILRGDTRAELEGYVRKYLAAGWKLVGGASAVGTSYPQPNETWRVDYNFYQAVTRTVSIPSKKGVRK